MEKVITIFLCSFLFILMCCIGCNEAPKINKNTPVKEEGKNRNFYSAKQSIARKARIYKRNKVRKVTEWFYFLEDNKLELNKKYKEKEINYNKNGLVTKAIEYSWDEKISGDVSRELSYNDQGRLQSILYLDKNKKPTKKQVYHYGLPNSTITYYNKDGKIKDRTKYKYDENWNTLRETQLTYKKQYYTIKHSYDKEGRISNQSKSYEGNYLLNSEFIAKMVGRQIHLSEKDGKRYHLKKILEYNDYGNIIKEHKVRFSKHHKNLTYYANGLPKVKEIGYKEDECDKAIFYHYEFYN